MYIQIDPNEEDEDRDFNVICAPQCLTDILVQVRRANDNTVVLTFEIGKLMREEIEGHGDMEGLLLVTNEEATNFARWADQLEIYAALMRSALKCRRPKSD